MGGLEHAGKPLPDGEGTVRGMGAARVNVCPSCGSDLSVGGCTVRVISDSRYVAEMRVDDGIPGVVATGMASSSEMVEVSCRSCLRAVSAADFPGIVIGGDR